MSSPNYAETQSDSCLMSHLTMLRHSTNTPVLWAVKRDVKEWYIFMNKTSLNLPNKTNNHQLRFLPGYRSTKSPKDLNAHRIWKEAEEHSCSSTSSTCCKAAISQIWNTEFSRILKKIKDITQFLPMFRLWDDRTCWLFTCILLQGGNPSFLRSTSSCLPGHKATVTCFTGKHTHNLQANASLCLVYDFWEALVGALQSFRLSLPHTGGTASLPCHVNAYSL